MLRALVRRLRRAGIRSRLRRAADAGVGIYSGRWDLSSSSETSATTLSDRILEWCHESLGCMRKPYGLDCVTLALAVFGPGNREIAAQDLGVLRPQDFYADGDVAVRLRELIGLWSEEGALASPEPRKLSALLFSWGDLVREMLPAG